MQMQYQLAVLDLDGTMLSTDGELPVTVRRSIAAVKARGIKVTLATGRRICRTLPWARTLEIDIPVVAHNGAVVVNPESGAVVSKQGISLSAANQVIDELLHLSIPFLVYRGEDQGEMGLLLEQFSQHRTEFLTFIDDQVELVSKLDLKSNPIKIAVLGQDYQLNPLLTTGRNATAQLPISLFTGQITILSRFYLPGLLENRELSTSSSSLI